MFQFHLIKGKFACERNPMNRIAIKMLVGDRSKYFGILVGLTFSSLLLTMQLSVFSGIMSRTFGFITDIGFPEIWVTDPKVQFIDDVKPLLDTELYRVRSVAGVAWAQPLYKGILKVRLANGNFQSCNVLGLDDTTLIGGPSRMVQGTLADLRRADAVIVDEVGSQDKLANKMSNGQTIPLKVGDAIEINDHRAVVVGICKVSRTFQSQPVIYTTYTRATTFAPSERKLLSFILATPKPGQDVYEVCRRIENATGLAAMPRYEFKKKTLLYFLKSTGLPINFGIAVFFAFLVGTIIAGMTFYNFTMENMRYFGTLKAMGATNSLLLRMIVIDAVLVGAIGYSLGVGGAALVGFIFRNTEMAFLLLPHTLVAIAVVVTAICVLTSSLCIHKIMKLEPAIVFKT